MSIFSFAKKTTSENSAHQEIKNNFVKGSLKAGSVSNNASQGHPDAYKEALENIIDVFTQSCRGNLEVRLLHMDHSDEIIRNTAILLNSFLDMTDAFIRESSATMEHACEKKYYRRFLQTGFIGSFKRGSSTIDQTREAMQDRDVENRSNMERMASDFEGKVSAVANALSASASQLGHASQSMTAMAESTYKQTEDVTEITRQATDNVGAVASATEELSGSINEISNQVEASSRVIKETVEGAEHASEAVVGLELSANEIDKVVELIRTIAGQTNLLALNATIEAARAGDAGKGFAVVASEVKNLANETSKATDDIVKQVENIQNAIKLTVTSIEDIQLKVNKVDEYASSITHNLNEQNAATLEISRNIQQAADGTVQVAENVNKISESSGTTTKMAVEVDDTTNGISEQVLSMQEAVEEFLTSVRQTS